MKYVDHLILRSRAATEPRELNFSLKEYYEKSFVNTQGVITVLIGVNIFLFSYWKKREENSFLLHTEILLFSALY